MQLLTKFGVEGFNVERRGIDILGVDRRPCTQPLRGLTLCVFTAPEQSLIRGHLARTGTGPQFSGPQLLAMSGCFRPRYNCLASTHTHTPTNHI